MPRRITRRVTIRKTTTIRITRKSPSRHVTKARPTITRRRTKR